MLRLICASFVLLGLFPVLHAAHAEPIHFSNSDFKEARAQWESSKKKLRIAFYNRNLSKEEIAIVETERSLTGGLKGMQPKHQSIADSVIAIIGMKLKGEGVTLTSADVTQYNVSLQRNFPGMSKDVLAASRLESNTKKEIVELSGKPLKNESIKFAAKGLSKEGSNYSGLSWDVSVTAPIVAVWE